MPDVMTWTDFRGRVIPLPALEDDHLANILRWVMDHAKDYPPDIYAALWAEAERRNLPAEFLAAAEIPYRINGVWHFHCRPIGES
jgi:hypothetical protein